MYLGGIELNSLGNLMILESHINRSISNKPYGFKIKKYTDSKYEIVKKQVKDFPEWDLDNAKKRKQGELEKLNTYIFGNNKQRNANKGSYVMRGSS